MNNRPPFYEPTCASCRNSYGALASGYFPVLMCSIDEAEAVDKCDRFEYEPGTDENEK